MPLDELALLGSFERSAATESIHRIIEQLARARSSKAFIRVYGAVPRNDFPLATLPASHAFRGRPGLVRAKRSAVPSIVCLEREDNSGRALSLLNRFAALAIVQCREQQRARIRSAQQRSLSSHQSRHLRCPLRARDHESDDHAADAGGQRSDYSTQSQ